jgi:hypothetical protein
MARKRKYDTEALVGQLKAERRTGILLTLVGVGILAGLATLYFTGVGQEEIPAVPGEGETATDVGEPDKKPDEGGAAAEEKVAGVDPKAGEPAAGDKPAAPTEAAPQPGSVNINAGKKPVLMWIDDQKLGKVTKKKILVPAGKHVLKTKVGKKTISQDIEVEAGAEISVSYDAKKKKFSLK